MTVDLTTRYAKAESLLPHNLKKLVDTPRVTPVWIRDTESFWYRNTTATGSEFILVDAEAGARQPAFDHTQLAESLSKVLDKEINADDLPFFAIELVDGVVRFVVDAQRIEVALDTYVATILGSAHPAETPSPDGRWAVGVRDHDLYLREVATDDLRQLTTDGEEGNAYGGMNDAVSGRVMQENLGFTPPPQIVWSPDSNRFITHRLDQRDVELMHLVRSAPFDGGRPQLMSYHYPLVGDENVAHAEFFVFDTATGQATKSKSGPISTPFVPTIAFGWVWWNDDGTKIYWVWGDRGDKTSQLHELDPETGEDVVLLQETSKTTILYGPLHFERNVKVLDSGEVLLWSQRSGWAHLYLYAADGTVTTITSGEWMVRKIVSVDEQARRVLFTAAGREPDSDIYLQELYSVSLDGGEITPITSDGLDHDSLPSKSGRFFVDVMSRVDVPAVSVLRDGRGTVVLELEQADASALYAAGWSPPERVVVRAADGVTDIYCAIYTPHDFDPSKKYPVLDEIYAGPQVSTAALRFPLAGGTMTAERSGAIFAALGFAVVAVDARGTALRHKDFQDHERLHGDGQYVDDHVAAIKQLAETRPWMDLDRVGIFGHSGGGLGSTRALLQAPNFFKVAVSSSGDHDDETYHAWWGEKFFGLADEFDFAAHSNSSLVDNLQGKLLLAHGDMDDNVTPHLTMRLVDALIKANKDFDLLIVPNAEHSIFHHQAYWLRRRWNYFVEHLMGQTPPAYRIDDIPFDPEMLAAMGG